MPQAVYINHNCYNLKDTSISSNAFNKHNKVKCIQEAQFKDEEMECEVFLHGSEVSELVRNKSEEKRECFQELNRKQGTPQNSRKGQQRNLLHQSLSHPGVFV